jgi:hypothetical protein
MNSSSRFRGAEDQPAKAPSGGGVECSKAVARQIQDGTFGNHHLIEKRSVKLTVLKPLKMING